MERSGNKGMPSRVVARAPERLKSLRKLPTIDKLCMDSFQVSILMLEHTPLGSLEKPNSDDTDLKPTIRSAYCCFY